LRRFRRVKKVEKGQGKMDKIELFNIMIGVAVANYYKREVRM